MTDRLSSPERTIRHGVRASSAGASDSGIIVHHGTVMEARRPTGGRKRIAQPRWSHSALKEVITEAAVEWEIRAWRSDI